MMKIGILCAGDEELKPFLPRLQSPVVTEKAMLKFYSGRIGNLEVTALYSGVCKVNAAIAAQILIDTFQTDCIVNAGTAGGMDESVQLFDTIVADRMIYHDVKEDILTDFHPWLTENFFKPAPELLDAAKAYSQKTLYPMRFGTVVTGEQFIEDDKREEINKEFSPLSADMESASVAHVCYANNIPFLSVRTITDTAEHSGIENFDKNCELASARAAEITIGILEYYTEMKNKTYIITNIQEDDYGCEERPSGEAVTVLVTVRDRNGRESMLRQPDEWLYEQRITEGDPAILSDGRLYKIPE